MTVHIFLLERGIYNLMNDLMNENQLKIYSKFLKEDLIQKNGEIFIGAEQIMCSGQKEIMEKYAKIVCSNGAKKILEVGYGGGVFSECLQSYNIQKHVIIECHPQVCDLAKMRLKNKKNVIIINDLWQNCFGKLDKFDGIFYDITSPGGYALEDLIKFIDIAFDELLCDGGIFSFWYCTKKIHSNIYYRLKEKATWFSIESERITSYEWKFRNRDFMMIKAIK